MEMLRLQICCCCLSDDRKMVVLENIDKLGYIMKIIEETKKPVSLPLSLCWECNAKITRCIIFRKQVIKSYNVLESYLKQEIGSPLKCLSNLKKQITLDLNISSNTDDFTNVTYQIIKTELEPHQSHSEPYPEHSDTSTYQEPAEFCKLESPGLQTIDCPEISDDDKFLIDMCKKQRKKKLSKKKERRKETFRKIELSNEEVKEERRLLELKEEYVNAVFKCERCISDFPNGEDLKDHVRLKHDTHARHKCKICECSFNNDIPYNYHMNKHTTRYECMLCRLRWHTKRAVTTHYLTLHCQGTGIDSENYGILPENGHQKKTDMEDCSKQLAAFACEFCDKKFRWKTSLRKHAETHRIESGLKRKPYCETCKLSFTTTSNLQKHVKTSSKHQIQLKLRKLKESHPEATSNPESELARIEQIKNSVNNEKQQYECGQCGKLFQWRGNLLRHVHSHTARANGELVCEPCNRTFSSIATYKQHMKISKKHVSENDFKYMCIECGKRFANKTRLKDHMDWEHLKNYVHKCTDCQKVFKSHTSLYLHRQVVHKKEDAARLCDLCGKSFPNLAKLRSHTIALHTSESPYKCSYCTARFSWHSCLSRHVRRVHKARENSTGS